MKNTDMVEYYNGWFDFKKRPNILTVIRYSTFFKSLSIHVGK